MPDKFEAPARLLLLWEGRRTAGDCKDAKGGMGGGGVHCGEKSGWGLLSTQYVAT